MRKKYLSRFILRCLICAAVIILYLKGYSGFDVICEGQFFSRFSLLHILWAVWIMDMILQLIPARGVLSLGSQKQFLMHFKPSGLSKTKDEIRRFMKSANYAGLKVGIAWAVFVCIIHTFVWKGILAPEDMIIASVLFYVADLICVLFWCPFRVFLMKNRCCATCRIFNWDHVMMFSPLLVLHSFYAASLFIMAFIVYAVWEVYFFLHPERFWEDTNDALKCANCTEYLCGKRKEN